MQFKDVIFLRVYNLAILLFLQKMTSLDFELNTTYKLVYYIRKWNFDCHKAIKYSIVKK